MEPFIIKPFSEIEIGDQIFNNDGLKEINDTILLIHHHTGGILDLHHLLNKFESGEVSAAKPLIKFIQALRDKNTTESIIELYQQYGECFPHILSPDTPLIRDDNQLLIPYNAEPYNRFCIKENSEYWDNFKSPTEIEGEKEQQFFKILEYMSGANWLINPIEITKEGATYRLKATICKNIGPRQISELEELLLPKFEYIVSTNHSLIIINS